MLDNNQWLGLGVIAGIAYLVDNDYRGGKEYGAESFEAEVCPCGCAMKGCVCSSSCKGECLSAESFEAFDKDGNVIMDEAYYNWSQPCDMCDGGTLTQEGDENDLWVIISCDSCGFSQDIKMKEAESLAVEEIEDSDWVCEACEYEGGHDPTKTDYCPNCGECIECCGFDESITRGAVSFGMCGLLGCDSCLTTSTDSAYMPYENFCAICDEQGDVDICEYCHTDADWEDPRYGIRGISYKPHEMKEHDFVPMKPPNTYNRKTGKSLKAEDDDSTNCEVCGVKIPYDEAISKHSRMVKNAESFRGGL